MMLLYHPLPETLKQLVTHQVKPHTPDRAEERSTQTLTGHHRDASALQSHLNSLQWYVILSQVRASDGEAGDWPRTI